MNSYTYGKPDPAQIDELERRVAKDPDGYRRRVIAQAIFGDIALTFVQLFPILLPVGVGLLIINFMFASAWFFNVAGVVVFVVLVWIYRPDQRLAGFELTRVNAPKLFDSLDGIRKELEVPWEMQVRVTDEFNAAAAETKGFLGLFGIRRTLILGMPLLCALSREEMLSVIAHEFGHFSRRHGRFGTWLYRAREGWLTFGENIRSSSSTFDRASAAFSDWFVPSFSANSFVLSRQQEYEADASAAQLFGAGNCGRALTKIHVLAKAYDRGIGKLIARLQVDAPYPPDNWHELLELAFRDWSSEELELWLQEALWETQNWADTHPPLRERLDALREHATLGDANYICAGESLLGGFWRSVRKHFNQEWLVKERRHWLFQHHRAHWFENHKELSGDKGLKVDTGGKILALRCLFRINPDGARTALRAMVELEPDNPELVFVAGKFLLDVDSTAAITMLERAAELSPVHKFPVQQELVKHYAKKNEVSMLEAAESKLKAAAWYVDFSLGQFEDALSKGLAGPEVIARNYASLWSAVMSADERLSECWILSADISVSMKLANGGDVTAVYRMHAVFLMIQPDPLQKISLDEGEICSRYADYMTSFLPSSDVVLAHALSTSLGFPQWLINYMDKYPEARCYKKAVNS